MQHTGINLTSTPKKFPISLGNKPTCLSPGVENAEGTYLQGPDDFSNDPYYWQDQIFRTGVTHDLNLNIAGQTKGYDYAISGGYLNQEGIVEGSDYTRYTIKLNLNRQVKDWLKVGANMAYTYFNANSLSEDGSSASSGNVFAISTRIAPIYPMYIRDGEGNIMIDKMAIKCMIMVMVRMAVWDVHSCQVPMLILPLC